jgi:hypothetical protein
MLRRHFNATTIIAIVALVFAMTGGAFAVVGKAGGSPSAVAAKKKVKKKGKAKVLRGPKGETGPAGAAGATGPAGPQGPAGPTGPAGKGEKGEKGDTGPEGPKGATGPDGKSIVTGSPTVVECAAGGMTAEVEGSGTKTAICNGENGAPGAPGPEGNIKKYLPKGMTETGAWGAIYEAAGAESSFAVPMSFNIPLEQGVSASYYIKHGEGMGEGECTSVGSGHCAPSIENGNCKGNFDEPGASEGYLCAFEETSKNATGLKAFGGDIALHTIGGGKSGAEVLFTSVAAGQVSIDGTWAVTAK